MYKPIGTCALIGKFQDARVAECILTLIPALQARQLVILAPEQDMAANMSAAATSAAASAATLTTMPPGVTFAPLAEVIARAELVIAIGGDGTLLYAAGLVAEHGIPLLGINRGRLGFLTDVLPQDMARSVNAVLAGECEADRRSLLQACLVSPDGAQVRHFALNDVVFNRLDTGRLLDFETRIDGRYVNSHGGDGLVVAPICPHTLSDRPIVIPGDSTIDIRLSGRHDAVAQVSCDASVLGELKPGGRLEVAPSSRSITLLHPPGYDYFRLLRSKLHWGLGGLAHER